MGTTYPTKKLGDVADFVRGITFKPDDVIGIDTANAVACMRTKNVQSDLDLSDVWGVPASFVKRDEQYLREGDILVSSANSWNLVGKCSWVPKLPYRATIGGFISCLRRISQNLDERYLFHWFSSEPVQALVRNCARKTTNISNLSFDQCLALEIPLPSLEEQKRIAAILDQADEIRRKRKQAIDRLNQLGQAIFHEMFKYHANETWPTLELADVVKSGTIVTYGIVQAGEEYPNGIPYIRTGDIKDGHIATDGLRHTSPEIASKFERSRVRQGEIVMSIRATVGTVAFVPAQLDGANLTQGTARIAPGEKTNPQYLIEYLKSASSQAWIAKQVKGATFHEITLTRLRELPVRIPPMALQNQFSSIMSQISKQLEPYKVSSSLAESAFTSLQHRAFTGQL